jgi:hypothetical protein
VPNVRVKDTILRRFIGKQGAFLSRSSAVTFYHILLPFLILTDSFDYLIMLSIFYDYVVRNKDKVLARKTFRSITTTLVMSVSTTYSNYVTHTTGSLRFDTKDLGVIILRKRKRVPYRTKNSTRNASTIPGEFIGIISNNHHNRHRSHQI